jgi:hypothetical protein
LPKHKGRLCGSVNIALSATARTSERTIWELKIDQVACQPQNALVIFVPSINEKGSANPHRCE